MLRSCKTKDSFLNPPVVLMQGHANLCVDPALLSGLLKHPPLALDFSPACFHGCLPLALSLSFKFVSSGVIAHFIISVLREKEPVQWVHGCGVSL